MFLFLPSGCVLMVATTIILCIENSVWTRSIDVTSLSNDIFHKNSPWPIQTNFRIIPILRNTMICTKPTKPYCITRRKIMFFSLFGCMMYAEFWLLYHIISWTCGTRKVSYHLSRYFLLLSKFRNTNKHFCFSFFSHRRVMKIHETNA